VQSRVMFVVPWQRSFYPHKAQLPSQGDHATSQRRAVNTNQTVGNCSRWGIPSSRYPSYRAIPHSRELDSRISMQRTRYAGVYPWPMESSMGREISLAHPQSLLDVDHVIFRARLFNHGHWCQMPKGIRARWTLEMRLPSQKAKCLQGFSAGSRWVLGSC
jgi:hypothetical protein